MLIFFIASGASIEIEMAKIFGTSGRRVKEGNNKKIFHPVTNNGSWEQWQFTARMGHKRNWRRKKNYCRPDWLSRLLLFASPLRVRKRKRQKVSKEESGKGGKSGEKESKCTQSAIESLKRGEKSVDTEEKERTKIGHWVEWIGRDQMVKNICGKWLSLSDWIQCAKDKEVIRDRERRVSCSRVDVGCNSDHRFIHPLDHGAHLLFSVHFGSTTHNRSTSVIFPSPSALHLSTVLTHLGHAIHNFWCTKQVNTFALSVHEVTIRGAHSQVAAAKGPFRMTAGSLQYKIDLWTKL